MRVQLMLIPDCPQEAAASELLRASLDAAGLSATPFDTIVVRTPEEAAAHDCAGSPTFAVDGRDMFPGGKPAVACRVYSTADGGLSGLPEQAALVAALRRSQS